jgi:glucan 1,3-beta-glucosidase
MVKLTRALAASLVGLSTLLPAIQALTTGFPYESQKIRGVNLGGWLVLEVCR